MYDARVPINQVQSKPGVTAQPGSLSQRMDTNNFFLCERWDTNSCEVQRTGMLYPVMNKNGCEVQLCYTASVYPKKRVVMGCVSIKLS